MKAFAKSVIAFHCLFALQVVNASKEPFILPNIWESTGLTCIYNNLFTAFGLLVHPLNTTQRAGVFLTHPIKIMETFKTTPLSIISTFTQSLISTQVESNYLERLPKENSRRLLLCGTRILLPLVACMSNNYFFNENKHDVNVIAGLVLVFGGGLYQVMNYDPKKSKKD